MFYRPENADIHADAGRPPRLLDEVRWVRCYVERFQVHLLAQLLARQSACDGADAGPLVACFGLPRDEALLILAMRTPAA